MRIETLYEFLLLTTNLNFTETAKSFYISQSVLSNHVSSLEKELGIRLFVRDSHSVRLTDAGEMFREDALKIVEDYEQALSHIAHYRDGVSSVIRIGFLLGSYGSFLPLACRRYHELHPEVEFGFSVLDIGEMQEALNDNLIDIGFTLFSKDIQGGRYEYRCLYEDEYKLAVPKTHRLADRTSVRMEDLGGETLLAPRFNPSKSTLTQMTVRLRAAGVEVRNDYRIKDAATLMAMVVSTGHVSLALDHLNVYGSGNLVFLPFENEDMSLCAGPIWKKSKETDVILSFIGFLEQETVDLEKRDFIAQKDLETPTGDRLP